MFREWQIGCLWAGHAASHTTGLAKRVGHGLREFPKSLRSNWRNNWRGGALALSPLLSSRKPAFLPSFFDHLQRGFALPSPINELDRYRSGIVARRIDGRKLQLREGGGSPAPSPARPMYGLPRPSVGRAGSSTRHADKNKMRRRLPFLTPISATGRLQDLCNVFGGFGRFKVQVIIDRISLSLCLAAYSKPRHAYT